MGVGAGLYMYVNCRRTKVHVRYLISWWVLVCYPTMAGGRRPLPPKMGDRSDPRPSIRTHQEMR